MSQLNIVFWNANGLSNHILEVKEFLRTRQIDVMLICETHFTQKSHLLIPQYDFYHVNHPDSKARGGSGILIRKTIKHHQGTHYCAQEIQATNIIVEDWLGPLTISSIYCPPKHNIKKDLYISFFRSLGNKFLACGDYNAKHPLWGSRLTSPKGKQLFYAIKELNLNVKSSGTPTYWPTDVNKTPDLIDFCVSKGIPEGSQNCTSICELSSDHSPVLLTVHCKYIIQDQKCTLHNKKTNWHYFRYLLSTNLSENIPLKTDEDLVDAVEHLVRNIQLASWNATPQKSFSINHTTPTNVLKKLFIKRKAKKTWQRTRSPDDKRKLNKATAELKLLLQNIQNENFEKNIQGLGPNKSTDYSLWKVTKSIKRYPKINHPIRKPDSSWTKSNLEKATTFANHLSDVFTPNTNEVVPENIKKILDETHQLDLPIKKFSKAEVIKVINTLKANKAPGYDLITPTILKELPANALNLLTYIYNACLTRCFVPPQWKVAQITMIQKPGKPTDQVKSYRPISLLSVLSKVLEILFLKRLTPIVNQKELIPDHQFGFRKNHGTIEQIHRLVETIHNAFESKEFCTAAFLDISQAFDKVWHEGLLYKIKKLLPINFYLFIKSYINDRHFYVQEAGEASTIKNIRAGVPQGSVLGPLLYLLFTADLPRSQNAVIGTFADDTAVLAVSKDAQKASNALQKYLNTLSVWLREWRIKANESKSTQVTYTLKHATCPPVQLNQIEIPQKDEALYLGIYLDRKLKWKKHIQTKRKALDIQLRKMKYLIGYRSKLSLENKILIYKCILKPIWTYGIQLWGTASNTNIKLLQQFQSKVLRIITNAPTYVTNERLHKDLNIKTVKEEISSQLMSYKLRIDDHPNPLAANLMSNRETFTRLKRKAPQDLIA